MNSFLTIVFENAAYPNYHTEKITDCFATGTIPIYYGCEEIGDFFDADGIITLTNDFDIDNLDFDLYYSKIEAIENNFKRVNESMIPEDEIYKTYIKSNTHGT